MTRVHLVPEKIMTQTKVLIIEDDPTVRIGITCIIEDAGYSAENAKDGVAGIELFQEQEFDVVITDHRLPGPNGIEVLKSIKGISPDTGVIVITSFAEMSTAKEAKGEGAYDFISKPFEPATLLMAIERFLSSKNRGTGHIYEKNLR